MPEVTQAPDNIEAKIAAREKQVREAVEKVDTYQDASYGKTFSRRFYNENNKKRPGGQILAVSLNPAFVNRTPNLYSSLPNAA